MELTPAGAVTSSLCPDPLPPPSSPSQGGPTLYLPEHNDLHIVSLSLFQQLVCTSFIRDTVFKTSPKVKGQFRAPSQQGVLAQHLSSVISVNKSYSRTRTHRCIKLIFRKTPVSVSVWSPKSWRCCSASGRAVYSWASSRRSEGIAFPPRPDREAINNLLKSALMRN